MGFYCKIPNNATIILSHKVLVKEATKDKKKTKNKRFQNYLFLFFVSSYICGLTSLKLNKMDNSNAIKSLEALRDEYYEKYKSIENTLALLKGSTTNFSQNDAPKHFALKSDGYDTNWAMKLKMSHILKREGKFLHIRQIADILHKYEPETTSKEFITKLYPAIAELKKKGTIVKFAVDNSNMNTFWGSKNWVDANGNVKDEFMFDKEQIKSAKSEVIEIL